MTADPGGSDYRNLDNRKLEASLGRSSMIVPNPMFGK